MQRSRERSVRAGFSLIELLVVIAIIVILAGMLTPALIMAMNKAHETATRSRIHQVETALQAFFDDYGDYPPTHWYEVDEFFKYDSNGDGVYVRADDEIWFDPITGAGPGGFVPDETTAPGTINEGSEVLAACLATRTGGPYLEPDADWLRNTDGPDASGDVIGDLDTGGDVFRCTNWYFKTDDIFELTDWWGNPLVYVHNRDYMDCDGWDEGAGAYQAPPAKQSSPAFVLGNAFDATWTGVEAMPYADMDGSVIACYARSAEGNVTGNYPNLNSFQLYSWGLDELPGCDQSLSTPGTPDPSSAGDNGEADDGQWAGWNGKSGNLMNWEE
jgi:prepilin-type N-terminal cleavage/methylation domain-containing protein